MYMYMCVNPKDRLLEVQSNLSYLGALGLGGARNLDLFISQNTIKTHKLAVIGHRHPLNCPQFLQHQHKIWQIRCPVEGGARITGPDKRGLTNSL